MVPVVLRWAESAPLAGRRLTDLPKVGDASGTPGTHDSGIPEKGHQPTSPTGELPIAAPASGGAAHGRYDGSSLSRYSSRRLRSTTAQHSITSVQFQQ